MKEEWRDVVGYEGVYMVSNMGNIRSMKRYGRTETRDRPSMMSHDGYKQIGLSKAGKTKMEKVHLLVLKAFVGPRPSEIHVARHLNNNRADARLDNLAWGTKKENEEDKAKAGSCKGERNAASKLQESDIPKIRQLLKDGISCARIGKIYGVSDQLIWRIKTGKLWTHVAEILS
ncbi:TPA: HNH endonuclease [Escherichia coli]|nr:HNH endonuclease [Escherichia coli]